MSCSSKWMHRNCCWQPSSMWRYTDVVVVAIVIIGDGRNQFFDSGINYSMLIDTMYRYCRWSFPARIICFLKTERWMSNATDFPCGCCRIYLTPFCMNQFHQRLPTDFLSEAFLSLLANFQVGPPNTKDESPAQELWNPTWKHNLESLSNHLVKQNNWSTWSWLVDLSTQTWRTVVADRLNHHRRDCQVEYVHE